MSITTLTTAKLHLKVETSADDTLIQIFINAAEKCVSEYLDRNVYADSSALSTAISGAYSTLAAATVAYDAAIAAADLLTDDTEIALAKDAAQYTYDTACNTYRRTMQGIVINDAISSAILLVIGDLYENRSAKADRALHDNNAVCYLLTPFRMIGL
jgi:hypothetical protein